MRQASIIGISFLTVLFLSSCSLDKAAMGVLADTVSKPGGTVFTGDDDPELVGDALPFALKFYETILEQTPDHPALLLSTGSAFIMYANAYVQTPASMLGVSDYQKKLDMMIRAKKLYLRGRDMVLRGIDKRHPGFLAKLGQNKVSEILPSMTKEDVPYLYWGAAGWVAAYSVNGFDINLSVGVPGAIAMMSRAEELDSTFNYGAIDDFFVAYYASVPAALGGSEQKAREHFKKAVGISKGLSASPYVSLATSLSIKNQDTNEFVTLLNQALAVDVNVNINTRLANILSQRKAKWYLDHIGDFFLLDEKTEE